MCKHRDSFGAVRENVYVTRNSDSIQPVFHKFTVTQESVAFVGPHTWNSLPVAIRSDGSYAAFKRLIKEYLIGLD